MNELKITVQGGIGREKLKPIHNAIKQEIFILIKHKFFSPQILIEGGHNPQGSHLEPPPVEKC